jgi:excisionase family DNA binding protein
MTTSSAPLLKVADVMERLQLGKSKVFELLARGELESIKIDGARRVPEEAVDDFIARRRAEARGSAA